MVLKKIYIYLGGFSLFLSLTFAIFTIIALIFCQDHRILKLNSLNIEKAKSESSINDIFSENIAKISSLNEAKKYIDSTLEFKTQKEIALKIQSFIRNSFVDGDPAYLYPCENWIIYFISEMIPLQIIKEKNINAIYEPERQLSASFSFCSQNAFIFQTLLKEYDITYSSVAVGTPQIGHWAVAAKLNGIW